MLAQAARWVRDHRIDGNDSFGEFQVTIGEMDALERFIGCYREKPYETIHGMRLKVIQDD